MPFDIQRVDVGDGHELYVEQVGNPVGIPVVYLHGGPGSGATVAARLWFDSKLHRAVLFDQRSAGRSIPHASQPNVHWSSIDMAHHLGDIETIRTLLRIDKWIVFGISWGSVLGLTYAQTYPERVAGLVLAAVSPGTSEEIDWLTEGVGRYFPSEWQRLRDHVPREYRHQRLVDAYNELLMDSDPAVQAAAAAEWCRWEEAHVATTSDRRPNPRYADPAFRLGFARQVTHCFRNNSWLGPHQLLRGVPRLAGIPGILIHGSQDVSGPPDAAARLHSTWPGSRLHIVQNEGHGGVTMTHLWSQALTRAGRMHRTLPRFETFTW